MQSFFASVEQLDFPYLHGQPIVVTNGEVGSTIITSSYEARKYGIKTGWKLKDALTVCPYLIRRASRPERYAKISINIMSSLYSITPIVEVFSIDEAFLDLKPILHLHNSIEHLATLIRKTIFKASGGLRCSIGISEGKLTAKFCAKLNKGNTTIIEPSDIKQAMALTPVKDICGIGKHITKYLNDRGVIHCQDMQRFPQAILASRFGDIGRRLYMTCLGHDPFPVQSNEYDEPKSMGHSKILPPATCDKYLIYGVLVNLAQRLASRLRKHHLLCQIYSISFKSDLGRIKEKIKVSKPLNDSKTLTAIATNFLDQYWHGQPLYYLAINALTLEKPSRQLELFSATEGDNKKDNRQQIKIDEIKDQINNRFGKGSVISATELQSKKANMIAVISPAWRPKGAKRSV
ncbi:DNA polymerase IV [bacterium SCSIO 12844]|nr:DNA polymerase IV [bacterium SCSIO 12844]